MPKGNKSSATAGTRKKHAKKSAKDNNDHQAGSSQQSKKLTKAEKKAKVKQYIPPPKPPAPSIPDPLDSQGLAHSLPPELVVALRRVGKKDVVTKRKGLEELREEWVVACQRRAENEDEEVEREIKESALVSAVPVWLHNYAQILQSPSHRTIALQIHQELLSIPSIRPLILDTFSMFSLPGDQCRNTLGSWLVAAVEERRRGGGASLTCWNDSVSFGPQSDRIDLEPHLEAIVEYLSLSINDPASIRDSIFPSPVLTDPIPLESEEEGWYRVGGLIGLAWLLTSTSKPLDLEALRTLLSGDLWSSLSPSEGAVGNGQPAVRRAAYGLLSAVMALEEDVSEDYLPADLLSFCWKETESTVWDVAGPAIAKCMRKHPSWWDTTSEDEDEDEDEAEDRSDDPPFAHFLQFVACICPSIPHLTYPLLMVAISSMPPDILPLDVAPTSALSTFFSHLWSPVDARLLATHALPNQQSSLQTFLQSALDCIILLVNRATKEENREAVEWLTHEQMGHRAWKQCVLTYGGRSGRNRAAPLETEATIFGEATARLAKISPKAYRALVKSSTDTLVSSCFAEGGDPKLLPRALPILGAVKAASNDDSSSFSTAVAELAQRCVDGLQEGRLDPAAGIAVLVGAVFDHYEALPEAVIDRVFTLCRPDFLSNAPSRSAIELLHALEQSSPTTVSRIQGIVADTIASNALPREARFAFLTAIFQHHHQTLLGAESLDDITEDVVQAALSGEEAATQLVSLCIKSHKLSRSSLDMVLSLCSTAIRDATHSLLKTLDATTSSINLDASLTIFCTYANSHLLDVVRSDIFVTALVDLHHLKELWQPSQIIPEVASSTYDHFRGLPVSDSSRVYDLILTSMSTLLTDVSCVISPKTLVNAASRISARSTSAILPNTNNLQTFLDEYLERPPDSSLAILDPLVPCGNESSAIGAGSFDSSGNSVAGRILEAVLTTFANDRQLATRDPRLLSISLIGQVLLQDETMILSGSRGLVSTSAPSEFASGMVRESEEALSFAFANLDDLQSAWHLATVKKIQAEPGSAADDWVQATLLALLQIWRRIGSDVPLRAFRNLLSRALNQSATQADAQVWLDYAMRSSSKDPDLSAAILISVKSILEESQAFSTARNRLANALTGIKTNAIASDGLPALRLLISSAPAHDAAIEYLPEQRAIFVLRHVTNWLVDDSVEDLPDELEFRLAELFSLLAPIVQNQPGQHWDSIFDVLESGLETSTLQEPSTWCLLHSSLVLLRTIRDLGSTNKSLRAAWTNQEAVSKLVLALFVQCRDDSSEPMKRIQSLLLDLVMGIDESRDKAGTALVKVTVAELCDLLHLSTNWAVQTMAYRLLSQVVRRDTLALVLQVEATIGDEAVEDAQSIQLSASLIDVVKAGLVIDWHAEPAPSEVVCQILAWMAILDHFEDASRTIRSAYMDQLRSTNLIEQSLLPMLFSILGVSQIGAWNFPASQFSVDEFYPELLEPEELADLTPFASFLFYRTLVSVPSIMREIHEGIKDRQLSLSLLNFTARHFSPVIIQNEFAALRQANTIAELKAEGLTVRVAQGGGTTIAAGTGSAEAIASYTVDEQPMEIGIRLPAEFPLRGVDVRDLRRVGVPENKWRGWLMSVQQTITSRNGLILEALTVFKRNVSLHFEGVVECAICYSIISLTDRTLPTKPCRTCKNRFHASCLFKWFNSSHSSSCPLCRTLF